MADRYYGVGKGLHLTDVTQDSSTTSKLIELRVNDGVVVKEQVLLALENFKNYIIQNVFPPA